jgi:deoxyribodipyrimidine photo-lyase
MNREHARDEELKSTQLVWFKRDLRIRDHSPLACAAQAGPLLCVYVFEPRMLSAPDCDSAHVEFVLQSLAALEESLLAIGSGLVVRVGEAVEVLESLIAEHKVGKVWSHRETGNGLSYQRDVAVARALRDKGIPWEEFDQHGVVRRLKNRDGWAARWTALMKKPKAPPPTSVEHATAIHPKPLPTLASLGLPPSERTQAQLGGENLALACLESFLSKRGEGYREAMSSPVTAEDACSRLSTYLAYGTVSMRTVYQATEERRQELKELRANGHPIGKSWLQSITSFSKRLRWHCHFMQKLEDEPELEFRNISRACDGLREDDFDDQRFLAWKEGTTGYPMVDACMRYLNHTGWINFRMRAMLMSFASYHLWLHWRPTSLHLARLFVDYEPGIHYSQSQMQSGTTGINAVRIYSPIKQGYDQDPAGVFIRKWVPELRDVPLDYLHEPYTMPEELQAQVKCVLGEDYPFPIVDDKQAVAEAKSRIYAVRRLEEAREEAQAIYAKHGSRRRPDRRKRAPKKVATKELPAKSD